MHSHAFTDQATVHHDSLQFDGKTRVIHRKSSISTVCKGSIRYEFLTVFVRFLYGSSTKKTARGVAETRLTVEKLLKGHNSGKNQSSIKYAHPHVIGTITGKLHQNPLKTVGVAETRLRLRTDGRTDGRTNPKL